MNEDAYRSREYPADEPEGATVKPVKSDRAVDSEGTPGRALFSTGAAKAAEDRTRKIMVFILAVGDIEKEGLRSGGIFVRSITFMYQLSRPAAECLLQDVGLRNCASSTQICTCFCRYVVKFCEECRKRQCFRFTSQSNHHVRSRSPSKQETEISLPIGAGIGRSFLQDR